MNSTPEDRSWILCPICQRPNPPDRKFCQHCWGAILRSGKTVSLANAAEVTKYRLFRLKHRRMIRLAAISLIALGILAAIASPILYLSTDVIVKPSREVNSDSLAGEWAMFRHDLGHSGATGSNAILPQGKLKWIFSTGSPVHSSPAVAGGTIYVGSRDNKLYALDADTGDKRWEYETGSWVESSPSMVNGVVYFGSNDGKLYALDAYRGEKLWDFKTSYAVTSSPAIAKGIVYFGSDDYYLYALNAATGKKLWKFDTKGLVKSPPVVSGGIIHFGTDSQFSYALNARNGRLRLKFKSIYPIYSAPAVKDGIVYFTSSNGYLFAIDGNARNWPLEHKIRQIWTQLWLWGVPLVPTPSLQSGLLWEIKLNETSASSPVVVGDTLYIGSAEKLLAIDLQSHKQRWQFETGGIIRSSPAVVDTVVYTASTDGRLYALDAVSGEKLWDFYIGGEITSSPTVADGMIYIGASDGNLYAIE